MPHAIYEFPLNEKVRTYLRLEQLFTQLMQVKQATEQWQYINFLSSLFTLLDLLERVDLRTDVLKDIESHEKNLVLWSQHPNIDNDALQAALQRILRLREQMKGAKKFGSDLKEDRFLAGIRQRFSIPGGTCSFDLPSMHYWLKQPTDYLQNDVNNWMNEVALINSSLEITLSFLRERGRFVDIQANKGFYQGAADDKNELIRVKCATDQGYYPVLSGNKHRYAIRFMLFTPSTQGNTGLGEVVDFKLACC
jgi:cell division protein ZapD